MTSLLERTAPSQPNIDFCKKKREKKRKKDSSDQWISNLNSLFDWKVSNSWFLKFSTDVQFFRKKINNTLSLFLQMPFFMGPLPVSYLVSYSWWALPVLIGCNHGKIHRVPSRTWVSGNFAFTNFDILIINLITFFMDVTLYMVRN